MLKPGGRFAVSDIVFQGDVSLIPDTVMRDIEAWAGCVAGALEEQDYLDKLRRAGFADAAIEVTTGVRRVTESCCGVDLSDIPEGVRVVSGFVRAVKPARLTRRGRGRRSHGSHREHRTTSRTRPATRRSGRSGCGTGARRTERCVRAGLLRRCTPVPPGGRGCCRGA